MTKAFADHFSAAASDYDRFRPHYPVGLFDFLASLAPDRNLAWDCATGTGQATAPLRARFDRVVASDASFRQISQGGLPRGAGVFVSLAESVPLRDACASLVTVGQALHWFDIEAFFREAGRVLKPGGVLAAWTYDLCTVDTGVDAVVSRFYRDIVGPYWPPERRLVEDAYAGIVFPFASTESVTMRMSARWSADDLLSYCGTWSAVGRYRDERGDDPVEHIRAALTRAWGTAKLREVVWPLRVLTGRRPVQNG